MYLNQMYGYVFRPVCDNYISLCMDMYLHQIVACNITKVLFRVWIVLCFAWFELFCVLLYLNCYVFCFIWVVLYFSTLLDELWKEKIKDSAFTRWEVFMHLIEFPLYAPWLYIYDGCKNNPITQKRVVTQNSYLNGKTGNCPENRRVVTNHKFSVCNTVL